jgi:hypothetical protein
MGTFIKLAGFLWKHRAELIEAEEAIRGIVLAAKQAKTA